ncbi:MAG: hypothetical protein QNJ44_11150 [Rhodobacter sp.]|nr:hypothetical protein [Rhodobacter sp.]
MSWVIVGAGPMGIALAIEGAERGLGVPLFVERSDHAAAKAKAGLAQAGLEPEFAGDLDHVDLLALDADVIYFAAPWIAVRNTLMGLLDRLHELRLAPVIIGLGSARLDASDKARLANSHCKVLIGSGLEPGLVESLITKVAAEHPGCVSITTFCGGIPTDPQPPLFFHRQFGSRPHFQRRETFRRDNGAVRVGERFHETELIHVPGVGLLEAFDDAMLPDTAADLRIDVPSIAQKTLRWPTYAESMRLLHGLGLLGDREIRVDGQTINIGRAVEAAICPEVPASTPVQVLVGLRAVGADAGEGTIFLSCTGDAQKAVSPMGYMTALPAISAYECLKSTPREGLYLPSDPALLAVAAISLERFASSGSVQVSQNGATLNLIAGEEDGVSL